MEPSRDSREVSSDDWKAAITQNSVVEVWVHGSIHFAHVTSLYERGIIAHILDTTTAETVVKAPTKVSFGEIISVWPETLIPPSATSLGELTTAVTEATTMLKYSAPRTIDTTRMYTEMRRMPKSHPRSQRTSAQIADFLFRFRSSQTVERRSAITIATAVLVANDTMRFKRAPPGNGWRALPASVTLARGRCSFVDACNAILQTGTSLPADNPPAGFVWSREQLDILRDLEIVAASGAEARGSAASSLEALGYEPNDDGAATLLLDINYWTTGPSSTQGIRERIIGDIHAGRDANGLPTKTGDASSNMPVREGENGRRDDKEWTFSPQLLSEARDLRAAARDRRNAYARREGSVCGKRRRSLLFWPDGQPGLKAYCVDDKSSRFLDDAISVQVLNDGSVIRLWCHIADVDEIVRTGSALDELAKERGQSLYLPLKPLHMLPAAAMDAASFSTSLPSEAITVMVEFDVESEAVRNWEVFPSVVPPVKRINYEQYDVALERGAKAAQLKEDEFDDLRNIAWVAPLLAEKLDNRRNRRKRGLRQSDEGGENANNSRLDGFEERGIASVRLIKRTNKTGMRDGSRMVKVVDFQMTRSHQAVDNVLTSAGGLMRQFARENRAHLPEERDAHLYTSRCGTAPLRRYGDLATQRQVKCILFGRQPAGKRRMDELRLWLAKRQSAGEKTLADRRRAALFDSFSSFCSQKCLATGCKRAVVRGQVRSVMITKRGILRVDVALDGCRLSTTTSVGEVVYNDILKFDRAEDVVEDDQRRSRHSESKHDAVLRKARSLLPPSTYVQVEISDVNPVAFSIQGTIVEML